MTKKRKEETVETGEGMEEAEVTAEPESELDRLRQELEEAQSQADQYLEGWQRAQAELANYRKRKEAEWQQQIHMSNASLIARILPVLDDLERAIQTVPPGLQGITWIDGVLLIKRKLEHVLESEGVQPIETAGQSFDPFYHEAVTYEEMAGYEDGQIIGEVQRGYLLGDRVIRPAMVRVARTPTPPPEEEQEAECED
jgi:molecular chaperone GrpE